MSATKTDYQGMITEIAAKKLLFGPEDDYKKGHNDAMDKAITTVRNYEKGEGLFQTESNNHTNRNNVFKQSQLVKERLNYHFKGTGQKWNIPDGMLFMKEFLNEVNTLCAMVEQLPPLPPPAHTLPTPPTT